MLWKKATKYSCLGFANSDRLLVPIEVKSGASGAMKSLHQFMFEKKLKTALRFDTNNLSRLEVKVKTTQGDPVQYTLLSAPVYLAERTFELLQPKHPA